MMRSVIASLAVLAVAVGHATAQTVTPDGPQVVAKGVAPKAPFSFPVAPNMSAGLAPAHLPEACGGGLLPANQMQRTAIEKACFQDLDERAKIASANARLDAAEHPRAPGTEGVPAGGDKLIGFTNAVAGAGSTQGEAKHVASAAGNGTPELLGGGCTNICVATFALKGEHYTLRAGQYIGNYRFVRLTGTGSDLAAVVEHDGKSLTLRLP